MSFNQRAFPGCISLNRQLVHSGNGNNQTALRITSADKLQIVGTSAGIQWCLDLAKKAASAKTTVLLLGESGTGKEIFGRTIHNLGERSDKPFVAINCVGLSKELLESELFGHEKGAFTGAHQLKRGKMELAHQGTVFLDEIGDIDQELQAKLLRFLQEREFERVGGTQSISVDIRIIAATNRDLEGAVKEGRFREDLFYRLNVLSITIPPLRERKEDIPAMARFFLERFSFETKKSFTGISQDAEERLLAYDWPGNVRELANAIERAVVLGHGPIINLQNLPPCIATTALQRRSETVSYRLAMQNSKRELIQKTLAQTNGNRAAAARVLGLRRTYLFKLIRALEIE